MKNINIKTFLFQWIGMLFFVNGIQRIYLLSQNEKYSCLYQNIEDPENNCWEKLSPNESLGDFLSNSLLWFFYAFIIGITILSIINWRYKIHWINSVLVLILTFILFPLKFFRDGFGSDFFNSFWGRFTNDITIENFARGMIFTAIAILLFYFSLRRKLNSMEN